MELGQLRYFLQIARRGNYTRAAEDLGISQSAMSRSIQKLEEELGQPVFERQSRSLSLTEAGVLLQVRAHQVISILEDTKAEITDDGTSGRIRIGAIPTIAPYYLPDVLKRFSTKFPKASLVVHENTTDALLKSCTQGEIDLAVVALPVPSRYLQVETLFDEELLLVMPTGHPLAERSRIRIVDIEPYPFVMLNEAHCLSENIESLCRQRAFQPVALQRTSQLATVQELVSLNHGISMIPEMARRRDNSRRRVYRSIANPRPTRTVAVVSNPYRFQSRLLKSFREHLKQPSD